MFGAIAAAVFAGQAAFLAGGHLLPNIWDASEYKELFIAIGLAAWPVDVALQAKGQGTRPHRVRHSCC
jgi:hypothetical protein